MAFLTPYHFLVVCLSVHCALAAIVSSSNAKCYFPDGSDATSYTQCPSSSTTGVSGCCDLSRSVCSDAGYCFSNNTYVYRGGCTDKSWKSQDCPQKCNTVVKNGYSNIYPCALGMTASKYCCGLKAGESCCNDGNFTGPAWGTPIATLVQQTTNDSSSTNATTNVTCPVDPSTNATAKFESSPSSNTGREVAVGAGVGVPLAACAIASLLLWFGERRKRTRAEHQADVQIAALERRWEKASAVRAQQPRPRGFGQGQVYVAVPQQMDEGWEHPLEIDGREAVGVELPAGSPLRSYR